jgi:hypothetical protein
MKKLWVLLAAVALAALLAACAALATKTSINDCVSGFMSDVNSGNYGNLYTHLDSSAGKYNQAKTPSYWSKAVFPSGETYTLTNQVTVGSQVTATLNSGVTYSGVTITFGMATDSDSNAVINSISITGQGTVFN